jgi:2-amino-4-hydroxy-6-hydroxymethyldihydropteridine diphosphokinase
MGLFVVSLGSNIQPDGNLACAVRFLLSLAKTLHLSRVVETDAVGVAGGGRFLNLAVGFESRLAEAALKQELITYEESFGRDRSDPDRKSKPRPLDLDILLELAPEQDVLEADRVPDEPYVRPVVLELAAYLGLRCPLGVPPMPRGVEIDVGGLRVGGEPTTLGLDPATGGPVCVPRREGGTGA